MSSSSSAGTDCRSLYCRIRKKNIMIWPAALSTFVLNRVCELVKEGTSRVQIFKNRDLKLIVEVVLKFTDREVGVDQLYNHPRHWRARWIHVCRLKMLEDVRWVKKTSAIMMDDDTYYAHIQTPPRDANLIKKLIEN